LNYTVISSSKEENLKKKKGKRYWWFPTPKHNTIWKNRFNHSFSL